MEFDTEPTYDNQTRGVIKECSFWTEEFGKVVKIFSDAIMVEKIWLEPSSK